MKHLYFAYGSNLSPTQMRSRCKHFPDRSAKPVGIGHLESWRWMINERGYANIVPPSQSNEIDKHGVYGILYDMDPHDEKLLDGYEGVDEDRASSIWAHKKHSSSSGGGTLWPGYDKHHRPTEQGDGAYNKWFIDVRVPRWFEGERDLRAELREDRGEDYIVQCLLYVDEQRTKDSKPKTEYIGRMNRGIEEACALGLPIAWVHQVIRKFIPENEDDSMHEGVDLHSVNAALSRDDFGAVIESVPPH